MIQDPDQQQPVLISPPFRPASGLGNAHLSTLWPVLMRPSPRLHWQRERLELADGDFIDLDWAPIRPGPLVVLLHGLEGSSRSGYVAGLSTALAACNWQAVVMHFRGCSGEPNRLRHSYNAATTADLALVAHLLSARKPQRPLYLVGFSLGANVLLKWLGEALPGALPGQLRAAVAVSVPFQLDASALRLGRGFSRLYQAYLLRSLRHSYQRKFSTRDDAPLALEALPGLHTLVDFDQHITAALDGFEDAWHYYRVASCRQYLGGIRHPVLIIQARDDPFSEPWAIPHQDALPPGVWLECHEHGGHVGFVEGSLWRPAYYLDRRIPAWLMALEQSFSAS